MALMACLLAPVVIAGCNSGSPTVVAVPPPELPPVNPTPTPVDAASPPTCVPYPLCLDYVRGFDPERVRRIRDSAEFRAVPAHQAINLDYALSTGLTGAGQTIAIVDSGFRLDHLELADKRVSVFSTSDDREHGTAVAAVAAGVRDGAGIHGVAPGADLHLSSFGGALDTAMATDAARRAGAIVQNNSWVFGDIHGTVISVDDVNAYLSFYPRASLARAMQEVIGATAGDNQAYLDALSRFTKTGVVVFGLANDDFPSASLPGALPELDPRLRGSWITAIDVVPTYNATGQIVAGTRYSQACLETAAYCLAAEGAVRSADDSSVNGYSLQAGTSLAAPQISGGVALLAQAFPDLRPEELVDRLLASADNRFFSHTGRVDFGNGVSHGYNREFGHGFMDLRAALLPMGSIGLAATSRSDGGTVPLSTAMIRSAGAHGDAFRTGLANRTVALFDGLGTDFHAPASLLAPRGGKWQAFGDRLRLFASVDGARGGARPPGLGFAAGGSSFGIDGAPIFGRAQDIGAAFGITPLASHIHDASPSLLGMSGTSKGLGASWNLPRGTFGFHGFADLNRPFRKTVGFGVVRAFGLHDSAHVAFGLSGMGETGSFLGTALVEGGGFRAASTAFSAGARLPAGRFSLLATAELGVSQADGAGVISDIGSSFFSGFSIAATTGDVFRQNDRLTVSLRQPMRVEAGKATMRLAIGRTRDGQVLYDDIELDLEPSARQLDLGFDYVAALSTTTDLRFAAAASMNAGHQEGQFAGTLMAAIAHRF